MVNENDKAEFNAAISYLNRINSLFAICTETSMELDIQNWFHTLKALYRELSDEMDKDEREKYRKKFADIQKKLFVDTEFIMSGLYNSLEDVEIDLRVLFKKTGMKMRYSQDARFSIQ